MSNILHVLEDAEAVIKQFFEVDGTEADVGAVDLSAVDLNGDAVSLTNTGTGLTAAGSPTGYEYTIDAADLAAPAVWDLTWAAQSGDVTLYDRLEVVGSTLLPETFQREDVSLDSETDFDDERLLDELWRVTDLMERHTGRSWVRRYRRYVLEGNGEYEINVRDDISTGPGFGQGASGGEGAGRDLIAVLAASVNGTALTVATDIEVLPDGVVRRIDGDAFDRPLTASGARGNVIIEATYGMPYVINGADHIAKTWVRNRLVRPPIDDRTIRGTGPLGETQFVVEGGPMRNPTRWPEINQWLADHSKFVGVG